MKKRPKSANRRLAVPTPAVKPTRGDDVARNVGIAALFVLAASSLLPWGGFLGRNYIGLVGEGRIIGPASLIAGLCLCFLPARMKGWSTAAYFIALWVGITLSLSTSGRYRFANKRLASCITRSVDIAGVALAFDS